MGCIEVVVRLLFEKGSARDRKPVLTETINRASRCESRLFLHALDNDVSSSIGNIDASCDVFYHNRVSAFGANIDHTTTVVTLKADRN